MNNKRIGQEFEKKVCAFLQQAGYWVHFITPDVRGAQPFDILAVKDGKALAIECKTLSVNKKFFSMSRLEDNQIMAFNKWIENGNETPQIWVLHGDIIKVIKYQTIGIEGKENVKINMADTLSALEVIDI